MERVIISSKPCKYSYMSRDKNYIVHREQKRNFISNTKISYDGKEEQCRI